MHECDISAASTAAMRGSLGPRGAVIGRAGGIWRVLAISTNGESRVGIQSRDGAWDPLHKSTLGNEQSDLWLAIWRQPGPARPYKGKHAGSSAHLKVGLHSGNMSLWTSKEKEKKEKEEKEEKEDKEDKEEEEEEDSLAY